MAPRVNSEFVALVNHYREALSARDMANAEIALARAKIRAFGVSWKAVENVCVPSNQYDYHNSSEQDRRVRDLMGE